MDSPNQSGVEANQQSYNTAVRLMSKTFYLTIAALAAKGFYKTSADAFANGHETYGQLGLVGVGVVVGSVATAEMLNYARHLHEHEPADTSLQS
jgi:hypothetical protein